MELTVAGLGFFTLLLLSFLHVLPRLRRWARSYWYVLKVPRPIGGHWFFGDGIRMAPENAVQSQKEMWELSDGKATVLRAKLGPFLHMAVMVNHESIAAILRTSEPKNSYIYGFMHPWIGDGLLTSSGRKWARNRRLLTPAFHFDILRGYANIYKSAAETMIDVWKEKIAADGGAIGRVSVSADVKRLTLDVLLQCAFSLQSGCQRQPTPYTNAVIEIIEHVYMRGLNVLVHSDFLYYLTPGGRRFRHLCQQVHSYAEDVIAERRKTLHQLSEEQEEDEEGENQMSKRQVDFLDTLLTARDSNGQGLSAQEIRDEVDTFLFEGHDTTASALQWAIYYVAKHQDVQQRCRDEATNILSTASELTLETIQKLEYTTQVVKETVRLATTVPFVFRELTKDVTVDGLLLTEGTWIGVSLWGMHHHPEYWNDPYTFNPSRFDLRDSSNKGNSTPFAFVPFSGGPRNCIGQGLAMEELKAVLALLVLEFDLSLPQDMEDVEAHLFLVTRPSKPIEILIKRRDDIRSE